MLPVRYPCHAQRSNSELTSPSRVCIELHSCHTVVTQWSRATGPAPEPPWNPPRNLPELPQNFLGTGPELSKNLPGTFQLEPPWSLPGTCSRTRSGTSQNPLQHPPRTFSQAERAGTRSRTGCGTGSPPALTSSEPAPESAPEPAPQYGRRPKAFFSLFFFGGGSGLELAPEFVVRGGLVLGTTNNQV